VWLSTCRGYESRCPSRCRTARGWATVDVGAALEPVPFIGGVVVLSDSSTVDLLASVDLFSELSPRQRKRLVTRGREIDHPQGHEVAHEGLGSLAFHLILSGGVAVLTDGRVIRELASGDYFGEISMIDGKPRSATVVTTEPTRMFVVPYQLFQELLREEPDVSLSLLKLLCARLREAELGMSQERRRSATDGASGSDR
jgi:CRP/FNR family cyclic AMP-dependent transcriptional regulator